MTKEEKRDLQQQFGMWLGLPYSAREPKLEKDLAEQMGVTPKSLSVWKNDPIVQQAKVNAVKTLAGKHTLSVVNKMIEKA